MELKAKGAGTRTARNGPPGSTAGGKKAAPAGTTEEQEEHVNDRSSMAGDATIDNFFRGRRESSPEYFSRQHFCFSGPTKWVPGGRKTFNTLLGKSGIAQSPALGASWRRWALADVARRGLEPASYLRRDVVIWRVEIFNTIPGFRTKRFPFSCITA